MFNRRNEFKYIRYRRTVCINEYKINSFIDFSRKAIISIISKKPFQLPWKNRKQSILDTSHETKYANIRKGNLKF
jgi:hypothetical protein